MPKDDEKKKESPLFQSEIQGSWSPPPLRDGESRVAMAAARTGAVRTLYEYFKRGKIKWEDMLLEMVLQLETHNAVLERLLKNDIEKNPTGLITVEMSRDDLAKVNGNSDAGKYGTTSNFEKKLHRDEPWFAVRGQDKLAPAIIEHYMYLMEQYNLPLEDIRSLGLLLERINEWQKTNPTKLPD